MKSHDRRFSTGFFFFVRAFVAPRNLRPNSCSVIGPTLDESPPHPIGMEQPLHRRDEIDLSRVDLHDFMIYFHFLHLVPPQFCPFFSFAPQGRFLSPRCLGRPARPSRLRRSGGPRCALRCAVRCALWHRGDRGPSSRPEGTTAVHAVGHNGFKTLVYAGVVAWEETGALVFDSRSLVSFSWEPSLRATASHFGGWECSS